MGSVVARRIKFSRMHKINAFVERLQKIQARGDAHSKQVEYCLGVCLSNPKLSRGFTNKIAQTNSRLAEEVSQLVAIRNSRRS